MKITVKYVLSRDPFFAFDSAFVPAEHFLLYDYETEIFAYLNSHLLPTDIQSVRIESDGDNAYLAIIYLLDEEIILHMPSFEPMLDSDLSF